jgi:hypothetical protein
MSRCFKVPALGRSCTINEEKTTASKLTTNFKTISATEWEDASKSEIGKHRSSTEFVKLKGTLFILH